MDEKRFVCVDVTREDGFPAHGTGYLVTAARVLTAGHLLDQAKLIVVWSDDFPEPVAATELWSRNEEGGVDAAVLALDLGETKLPGITLLARTALARESSYQSRGFPRASLKTGMRMRALDGRVPKSSAQRPRFEVFPDAPPSDPEDWLGISGAPIFVDGYLVGVVSAAPKDFGARRVDATAVSELLDDTNFCAKLGYEAEIQLSVGRLVEQLSAAIERSQIFSRLLCHAEAGDLVDGWRTARGSANRAGELAVRFLATRAVAVLTALDVCHRILVDRTFERLVGVCEGGSDSVENAIEAAEEVIDRIVPLQVATEILSAFPSGVGGFLAVPCSRESVLELVIAGVDRRSAHFEWKTTEKENQTKEAREPKPKGLLPLPVFESGNDPDGRERFRDWLASLEANQELFSEQDRAEIRSRAGNDPAARDDLILDYLNEKIERLAARHMKSPLRYYLVLNGLTPTRRAFWEKRLQERVPALWRAEKTGSPNFEERAIDDIMNGYVKRRLGRRQVRL